MNTSEKKIKELLLKLNDDNLKNVYADIWFFEQDDSIQQKNKDLFVVTTYENLNIAGYEPTSTTNTYTKEELINEMTERIDDNVLETLNFINDTTYKADYDKFIDYLSDLIMKQ